MSVDPGLAGRVTGVPSGVAGAPDDEDLVRRFGSPLFVYDAAVIRARILALREALGEDCAIHYAVKANPSLGVLALLRSLGAGAEVASQGELAAALRAGFPPARILWAGPAKTDEDLLAAASHGLAAIHAESDGEIRRLDALGTRLGRRIDAGVRVHVPWSATESNRIIGGSAPSKFGVAEEDALRLAPAWASLPGVRLRSVHVFSASNVLDAGALADAWGRTLRLAQRLRDAGLPVELVDLGGGLGVPYLPGEIALDVRALGEGLRQQREERRREGDFAPLVAVEPGRHLVAEAGRYLVRVVGTKTSLGVTWIACDGGIHHLLRPALVGQPHRIRPAGHAAARAGADAATHDAAHAADAARVDDSPRRAQRVTGPLCTSLDDFGEHELPELEPGDLLCVENAGAYGFTESMPMFLSHPVPAEVMLLDGEAHLLRPRREPERLLEEQAIPPVLLGHAPGRERPA